jgi:hypothetical protein
MAQDEPNNRMDLIDSREIIKRIESLEEDLEIVADDPDYLNPKELEAVTDELRILKAVQEEAEGYASDWRYGETLIRDTYFKDYAQELAEECGMVTEGSSWPNTCLDWERAARELKYDYTSVDYAGIEYWIRAS